MMRIFNIRKTVSIKCNRCNVPKSATKVVTSVREKTTYGGCSRVPQKSSANLNGSRVECIFNKNFIMKHWLCCRLGFGLLNCHIRSFANLSPNNRKLLKSRNIWSIFAATAVGTLSFIAYYKRDLIFSAVNITPIIESTSASAYAAEPMALTPLPDHVQYLLIGGGTASFSAFRSIRGKDPDAKILVISEEASYPYMRPPLSKELWFSDKKDVASTLKFRAWSGKERDLFYEKREFFIDPEKLNDRAHGGVSIIRGRKVAKLDIPAHTAILADGAKIKYDKCLIATGGTPKNLKEIIDGGSEVLKRTTIYRKVDDFVKLFDVIKHVKSVVVVGGGFLGSELSVALARHTRNHHLQITQLFPESGILAKILPEYLSEYASNIIKKEGVNVMSSAKIEKASIDKSNKVNLQLDNGTNVSTDHVIVAVGIDPNVELAKSSGLEIDKDVGGFMCDAELRARTDVWVAGDCCSFYDVTLGRRRVEHHDHAIVSGRLAGENMTGAAKPYWHQSMFWSDLGPEFGCEAIGLVDSSLPTVGIFAKATDDDKLVQMNGDHKESKDKKISNISSKEQVELDHNYDKGVVFYMQEKRVAGILLWNVFNRIPIARKILKENLDFGDLNELAKLFNIHDAPPVEVKDDVISGSSQQDSGRSDSSKTMSASN